MVMMVILVILRLESYIRLSMTDCRGSCWLQQRKEQTPYYVWQFILAIGETSRAFAISERVRSL
jgi:uncharacterized membrane protein YadS